MLILGVNVDHVATVREARKVSNPDPLEAALICEMAGAGQITAHLREDRRHMRDEDLKRLAENVKVLNMEMAATKEMVEIASKLKPHTSCLVPEKREELTTEGGLDVAGNFKWIKDCVARLRDSGVMVSLFIDPEHSQVDASVSCGADYIELHTGAYANADGAGREKELARLVSAAGYAHSAGLKVNAGHGIDYDNMAGILEIPHLRELNIGHSIVARAVIAGMYEAVKEMLDLMSEYPES
jgi:pyridoxine 5-phosphate synthase